MISLRILEVERTIIRHLPPSIVRLKNLIRLSLFGVERLQFHDTTYIRKINPFPDDEIPKDLGSLISLQDLDLQENNFHTLPSLSGLSNLETLQLNKCFKLHTLPSLSGLSKLETLKLNDCFYLHTIPDLPTNLKFLYAVHCHALETMPNFSEMSNMRELTVNGSPKLTEVPGLDKSLNFMTLISMVWCTNLTADFTRNILQGWTSCGFGGIFLPGNYVPNWIEFVNEGSKVSFDIPLSDDRNFEGLTMFYFHRSGDGYHPLPRAVTVINNTKRTELRTCIDQKSLLGGQNYLWQGQLSNDKLKLQGGDKVEVNMLFPESYISGTLNYLNRTGVNLVWDKPIGTLNYLNRTGVNLVWDKPMKENMQGLDRAGYVFDQHPARFYGEARSMW